MTYEVFFPSNKINKPDPKIMPLIIVTNQVREIDIDDAKTKN